MPIVTFKGINVSVINTSEYEFLITANQKTLYSGATKTQFGAALASIFPREFKCYCVGFSEIGLLAVETMKYGTLVIDGISYPNSWISKLGDIKEVEGDSPTNCWYYTVEFKQDTA